jgi:hypothetical protein
MVSAPVPASAAPAPAPTVSAAPAPVQQPTAPTTQPVQGQVMLVDQFNYANENPDAFMSRALIAELERIPTYDISDDEKMMLAYNEAQRLGASTDDLAAFYGFDPVELNAYYAGVGVAPLEAQAKKPTPYTHPELFEGHQSMSMMFTTPSSGTVTENYDGSYTVYGTAPDGTRTGQTYNPDGTLRDPGGPRQTMTQMQKVAKEPNTALSKGPSWAMDSAGLIAGAQAMEGFAPANYQEMQSFLDQNGIPFGAHFSEYMPANGGASRPSATDGSNLGSSTYDAGPLTVSYHPSAYGGTTLAADVPSTGVNTTQAPTGIERGDWSALAGVSSQPVPSAMSSAVNVSTPPSSPNFGNDSDFASSTAPQFFGNDSQEIEYQQQLQYDQNQLAAEQRNAIPEAQAYYEQNVLPQVLQDPVYATLYEAGIDWTDPVTRSEDLDPVRAVIEANPEVAATLESQFATLKKNTGTDMVIGDTDLTEDFIPFLISYGVTDLQDLKVLEDGTIYNTATGLDVPAQFGYSPTITAGVRGTFELVPVPLSSGEQIVVPNVDTSGKKSGVEQALPVVMAGLAVFGGPITGWLGQTLAPSLGTAAGAGAASASQIALGNTLLSTGIGAATGQSGSDLLKTAITAPVAGYVGSTVAGMMPGGPAVGNITQSMATNATKDLIYGNNPIDRYGNPMSVASLIFKGFQTEGGP